ncbi:MAG: ferritin family protein [candidate division WOR-3 bacterium]
MGETLTPLEILQKAIKSEIEAYQFYNKLEKVAENKVLEKKLNFLKKEEKKHERLLRNIFKNQFPKEKIKLPEKGFTPLPAIDMIEKLSLESLLEAAMEAEEASEKFYRENSILINDENSKRLLIYLSSMEKSHYQILKTEYDLLTSFTSYEAYKKFSLEHLGP